MKAEKNMPHDLLIRASQRIDSKIEVDCRIRNVSVFDVNKTIEF